MPIPLVHVKHWKKRGRLQGYGPLTKKGGPSVSPSLLIGSYDIGSLDLMDLELASSLLHFTLDTLYYS